MKRYLIAGAALLALSAQADPVARSSSGDSVRFTLAACPAEIAALVPQPELRERLRKAIAHVGGQDWLACWIGSGGARYLVFSDGDQGMVPESDIHEEPGA